MCLRKTLVLNGVLNGAISDCLPRYFLLLRPDLNLMPPRKVSTRRSMASMARSQRDPLAPASYPISQDPPPPATAVGMEQFDLLVQQVRGLTEVVQAMQQQPQASVQLERASSEFQDPAVGWATWASRPVFPRKGNPRVESPQSDHDSTPGGFLPLLY